MSRFVTVILLGHLGFLGFLTRQTFYFFWVRKIERKSHIKRFRTRNHLFILFLSALEGFRLRWGDHLASPNPSFLVFLTLYFRCLVLVFLDFPFLVFVLVGLQKCCPAFSEGFFLLLGCCLIRVLFPCFCVLVHVFFFVSPLSNFFLCFILCNTPFQKHNLPSISFTYAKSPIANR